MCDYSLETYRSRPARKGEKYTLIQFESGSIGFASPGDCMTAVCVQSDTRLRLAGIPVELQRRHGIGATEDVTMVHLEQGRYRDGVEFANGVRLSLQHLQPGITATITSSLDEAALQLDLAEVM